MIHRHFCPSCRQYHPCDARECIRDESFECLACCVTELKRRRPEAFIEPGKLFETVEIKPKRRTKRDLAREAQMKIQRSF